MMMMVVIIIMYSINRSVRSAIHMGSMPCVVAVPVGHEGVKAS